MPPPLRARTGHRYGNGYGACLLDLYVCVCFCVWEWAWQRPVCLVYWNNADSLWARHMQRQRAHCLHCWHHRQQPDEYEDDDNDDADVDDDHDHYGSTTRIQLAGQTISKQAITQLRANQAKAMTNNAKFVIGRMHKFVRFVSLYVCLSVCLPVCLFVFLFVLCLYVCLSLTVFLYLCLPVFRVFACLSLSVFLSVCLYLCLSLCLSLFLSFSWSVCLPF